MMSSLLEYVFNTTFPVFITWATYILLMWFSKRKLLFSSFGMKTVSK